MKVTVMQVMATRRLLMDSPISTSRTASSFEAARYDGSGVRHHLIHGEDSWLGPARGKVSRSRAGRADDAVGLPTKVVADPARRDLGQIHLHSVMTRSRDRAGRERRALEVPEMRARLSTTCAECIGVAEALGIRLAFDPMYLVKKRRGESAAHRHAARWRRTSKPGRRPSSRR